MSARPKHAKCRKRSRRYVPGLVLASFLAPALVLAYPSAGGAAEHLVGRHAEGAKGSVIPEGAIFAGTGAVERAVSGVGLLRSNRGTGAPVTIGTVAATATALATAPGRAIAATAGPATVTGTNTTTTSNLSTGQAPSTSSRLPGSSSSLPGSSSSLPGSSSPIPGSSRPIPGSSSTGPGSSSTAPDSTSASLSTTVPPSTTTTVPLISGGPSIQPVTGAPVGPPGSKKQAKGGQSTTTGVQGATTPPGTAFLLSEIDFEQRQMSSLDAVVDAKQYLAQARRQAQAATSRLARVTAQWHDDIFVERADQAIENSDARTVALYQRALYELGLAEYTGQSVNEGSDLAAIDNQIDASLLGDVAAVHTQAGLQLAQRALAVATVRTQLAREAVARAAVARDHARHLLVAAKAQVVTSQRDIVVATQWATIPGKAPSSPVAALAKLEGRLGKQAGRPKAKPVLGTAADSGLSSFTVTTGPEPGSVVPPTTVPTTPATTTTVATTVPASAGPAEPATAGAGASAEPASVNDADLASQGPTVIGTSLLTAPQMVAWFESTGARANTTVPISQLVADYLKAGQVTGVRGDIAFAQSIVETGYFAFPTFGQDPARYNNFAGIGACDHCKHGWKFPTAMAGVMSQELLLEAYATPPAEAPDGSQAPLGVEGCCRTWMGLSGVWASNKAYGFEILSIYHQMLEYSLADDLAKAGLSAVVPAGPGPMNAPVATTSTTQPVNRPGKSSPAPSRTGHS